MTFEDTEQLSIVECPVCSGISMEVYRPRGSRIELVVHVCDVCGLVHTTRGKASSAALEDRGDPVRGFLSCEADYSAIRVGKQQMTRDNVEIFGDILASLGDEPDVMDMAAARGHFVNYLASTHPRSRILALEPDQYMAEGIQQDSQIEVVVGDFRTQATDREFDFIYSCHTLEHYSRPLEHLNFVARSLKRGGRALIDVPDLSSIGLFSPLDEFFYDKHRVYFTGRSLEFALGRVGLTPVKKVRLHSSLKFLVSKADVAEDSLTPNPSEQGYARSLISDYVVALDGNRRMLPAAVEVMTEWFSNFGQRVALGAGRVFDAAVRYGFLEPSTFDALVDNFLVEATPVAYGQPLRRLQDVTPNGHPAVAVFARQAGPQLENLVRGWNEGAQVRSLSAILAELRP